MATLISAQGDTDVDSVTADAQSLFAATDSDGDGQISTSEFEDVFGADADVSKVDGLFTILDSNGDGSVSEDEVVGAARQSNGLYPADDQVAAAGEAESDDLSDLLSSTDATSSIATNSDGSTTTTITYADGSSVSATTATSDSSDGDTSASHSNLIEELINLQARYLSPATTQDVATV
jgi:hypothetical protein